MFLSSFSRNPSSSHMGPTQQKRNCRAAVVCDEAQLWQAIQYFREDEASHRYAGLVRPSQHDPDLILGFCLDRVIRDIRWPIWVHPHRKAVAVADPLENRKNSG